MALLLLLGALTGAVSSYKPVILVHGLLSQASHLDILEKHIITAHPGTNVTKVHLYPEVEAFVSLTKQLTFWHRKIKPIMDESKDGVHFICHSQGGLICQGLIEFYDHNVHNFISLSAPLAGQFGVTSYITRYLPFMKKRREALSRLMYTWIIQREFSFSNYWKDPRREYQADYEKYASYLPVVANDPQAREYNETEATTRKKRFIQLSNLVLVGGPGDTVITPWQSSHYDFYDPMYNIIPMRKQKMFVDDWFGLRTLQERGAVHTFTFDGVRHVDWHKNVTVFREAIKQWLV